jgi:hypothetical protein
MTPRPLRYASAFGAVLVAIALLAAACTGSSEGPTEDDADQAITLQDPPRQYVAEWLINGAAVGVDSVDSPFLYREIVNDQTGMYLAITPNHVAIQSPDEVVFCAAVSRLPLDPYCAASRRADGSPHVFSYPIQLIRGDWSPSSVYDLASYREVSLVAESDPDAWSRQITTASRGFSIECFLAVGETSAASTGFEVCFTNDDLRLIASVDLQNDLIFEIDLVRYDQRVLAEDLETGLEEFVEQLPNLQEQLLDLYPEIPAPRPTPTPDFGTDS